MQDKLSNSNNTLVGLIADAIVIHVLPILKNKDSHDDYRELLEKCIQIIIKDSSFLIPAIKVNLCLAILNCYCPTIEEERCITNLDYLNSLAVKINELQLCRIYQNSRISFVSPSSELQK